MKEINLADLEFQEGVAALIYVDDKGSYEVSNQIGGHGCKQGVARAEKIELIKTSGEIEKHFDEKYGGWCFDGIDEETAKFLDLEISSLGLFNFTVNRSRLKDCMEAWVHGFAEWFSLATRQTIKEKVILTWGNCD